MNYLSRQFDAACEAWADTYSYCCVIDVDDYNTRAYHRAANVYAHTVLSAANAVKMWRDKLRLEYDEFKYQLEQPRLRAAMGWENVNDEALSKLITDITMGQSEPGASPRGTWRGGAHGAMVAAAAGCAGATCGMGGS